MNLIKSVSNLQWLLNSVNAKKSLTNCYLYGNDFSKLVVDGLLYYQHDGENLFIFKKNTNLSFFEMYFYFVEEECLTEIKCPQPVVVEIPYRSSFKYPQIEIDILTKCGFSKHINRDLFFLDKPDLSNINLLFTNFKTVIINDKDLAGILATIILESFDYYTGDVLSTSDLRKSIENGEILALYQDDVFAGFLRFYLKNNVSWIGHIVVLNGFGGQGLGKLLVYDYLRHQTAKGINYFQHWVVSTNYAAIKLYEHFGFKKMNKNSISLIKEK
jgi:ribosomal protein S18 acetylase RimI-like enzyme